jgi:hypothetical protein
MHKINLSAVLLFVLVHSLRLTVMNRGVHQDLERLMQLILGRHQNLKQPRMIIQT